MTDFETLQRLALVAVEKTPWEYTYRKICRWYSTTFATPLHVVEMDLQTDDVMQHYLEHQIEKMKDAADDLEAKAVSIEAWDKYRSSIINGHKVASEEDQALEADDDQWAEEMAKMLADEEAAEAAKKKPKQEVTLDVPDAGFPDLNLFESEVVYDDSTPPDYD